MVAMILLWNLLNRRKTGQRGTWKYWVHFCWVKTFLRSSFGKKKNHLYDSEFLEVDDG